MKSIIFLADGMADEPLEELGGRTPLEAVETPAMDRIARLGANGTFLSLPPGLPTSSDVANMSVLGFYPERNYPGRGPIEAVSQGIALADDDVAWRCNLVTVSPDGILLDYSAGHIDNAVSAELIAALQREFGSGRVSFHPGVSYRNLLVLHGREFSADIGYQKPDSSQGIPVDQLQLTALDDSPEARHTVRFLQDLSRRAAAFLAAHPLNRGKTSPANEIWPWSPGRRPNLQPFSRRYAGRTGAIISAVDVIRGIGKAAGMTVVEVPGATGFIDTNYEGKVAAALKALEDHDFVYIHVEAIDECSHMGDLALKMRAIRDFDCRIVAPVLEALRDREVLYAVLPDHPVPLKLRKHTRTPVPVAVCGPGIPADAVGAYSERLAPQGALGALRGDQLMKIMLQLD
ncbi:cofactor-independent phosphoglycerate mutase [Victivallis sp. Marseille-Q1083]|uniref:cofactor-independent phosphoglycerate mutase n=1 Tax=Victivallis sp. Marseille-Q1083 TaxID=2717288 RepID=UPI00158BFB47|nr:cofactor-independent phosphoglycerate mutase [Victivallis sp. Marseille-Q1083]